MCAQIERRYRISEISEMVQIPLHVLRQWEERFPQLKPKSDRSNRLFYLKADIDVVQRIKQLIRHEKLTTKGAIRALSQEMYGEGRPKTNSEVLELLDKMETEIRGTLDLIDAGRVQPDDTKN